MPAWFDPHVPYGPAAKLRRVANSSTDLPVDPEFGLKRAPTGQEGDWMKLVSSVCASAILGSNN